MRKYGIFGILFLSLCLFGAVHTAYAAEEEESLQITQEELLDEFDFSDLDDSLKKMFPREGCSCCRGCTGRYRLYRSQEGYGNGL